MAGVARGEQAVTEALTQLLARTDAAAGRVQGLRRLTGGATKTTWAFDWVRAGVTRALILQQTPALTGLRGRAPKLDAREDAAVMRLARAIGSSEGLVCERAPSFRARLCW